MKEGSILVPAISMTSRECHIADHYNLGLSALPGVEIKIVGENGMMVPFGTEGMEIAGTKILPSFVEEIIKKNKTVKEAVVFSVKDTLHNDDMPCAAVVRTDEKALTEHSLKAFMKKELQFFQEVKFLESIYLPKHTVFHKELPKTPNGKSNISLPYIMTESGEI